jgi:hypothetical protein
VNWLCGRVVRFHLSEDGRKALSEALEEESIVGFVEIVDSLGAWIAIEPPRSGKPHPLRLLRWNYISTAVLEVEPVEETPKARIGFSA